MPRWAAPLPRGRVGIRRQIFSKNSCNIVSDGKNNATGKKGAPLDYITFHAKGDPEFVNGHVQMNMAAQLQDVARVLKSFNHFLH